MTDIVDRLLSATRDAAQSDDSLHQDAADEIKKLREEIKKMKSKADFSQRMSEPEF